LIDLQLVVWTEQRLEQVTGTTLIGLFHQGVIEERLIFVEQIHEEALSNS